MTLVGRSSSHYTRTARLFALELAVPHTFQPVLDMTVRDPAAYAANPALKVPVLIDGEGPLYGTENICAELTRRAGARGRVVLRGDVGARIVANAEEMVLHGMVTDVALVMAMMAPPGETPPPPSPKLRPSLENALGFLDRHVGEVRAALPADRLLSYFEAALFCLVTHLPFRKIMEVTAYPRLQDFCREFGARAGARATEYRFDAAA